MDFSDSFIEQLLKLHRDASACPPPGRIIRFFDNLLGIIFPEFSETRFTDEESIKTALHDIKEEFSAILNQNSECVQGAQDAIGKRVFDELPKIQELLMLDIDAMYLGDPAAKSKAEVIRTYPGFYAIAAHRIAHCLLLNGVNLIPRIISEHAHRQTGIDIHPGAIIGDHFCIDHGTGIVIGETTTIGNHVKIYQGVTLGGLSVKKEDAEKKRHPTIENHVVIYAGASILGGDTVIGEGSIIGGNVWLTKSVPKNSKVYYQAKMTNSEGDTDTITFR